MKNTSLTYGEVTSKGILQLINYMENNNLINAQTVFVDIGCGYGTLTKMIQHLVDIEVIGIEIDPKKAEIATEITKWTLNKNKIKILSGSFEDYPHIFNKATVIFSNCISFDQILTEKLLKMVGKNTTFIHNSAKINEIISPIDILPLYCTWSCSPIKYYRINDVSSIPTLKTFKTWIKTQFNKE